MDRQELARQELARREMARRFFVDPEDATGGFAPYVMPGWPVGAGHLGLLGRKLDGVRRWLETGGEEGIGRLMVWMPPRHWKSMSASVLFVPYILGVNPDWRVIVTSYNAALATGFSRMARNLMEGDRYRAVFGDRAGRPSVIQVSDDSRSAEKWDIAGHKGGVKAAGVGGGITGTGANLFVIDDPHKDRRDAESETSRKSVWDWFVSTAYTRLEKDAAMVVIQTRWHPGDLSGMLLRSQAEGTLTDEWEVLCLPAFADEWAAGVSEEELGEALKRGWWKGEDALGRWPGEPLWPEVFDRARLEAIKANVGAYEWEALYLQRPQRIEGGLIRAYDMGRVLLADVPETRDVRFWDLAVSGRKRADWIVGVRLGRAADRRTYVKHVARFRGPWADARPKMTRVMLSDGPGVRQGIEHAGQQLGYAQELQRDPRLQGVSVVAVRVSGSKEVRANVWASRIQDALMYVVTDGGWDVEGFLSRCVSFPDGAVDEVDGVSGSWQMLAGGGRKAKGWQG